jgi:hypothetical protein
MDSPTVSRLAQTEYRPTPSESPKMEMARPQFSIRTLLLVTMAVGVIAWTWQQIDWSAFGGGGMLWAAAGLFAFVIGLGLFAIFAGE